MRFITITKSQNSINCVTVYYKWKPLQISAKLEFEDELSPVPTHQYEGDVGNEYADDLRRVVDLLASLGQLF